MNQITPLEAVYHAWRTRLKRRGTPVCVSVPRYRAHPDKGWSLTDCLNMEAMLDHGVTDVATSDHHFAQAGFRTLMSASDVA
jgi:hypothetical protein